MANKTIPMDEFAKRVLENAKLTDKLTHKLMREKVPNDKDYSVREVETKGGIITVTIKKPDGSCSYTYKKGKLLEVGCNWNSEDGVLIIVNEDIIKKNHHYLLNLVQDELYEKMNAKNKDSDKEILTSLHFIGNKKFKTIQGNVIKKMRK